MKDLAFLACMLVLAAVGLTFTCHLSAEDEPMATLLPDAAETAEAAEVE